VDIVQAQIKIAGGASLAALGLGSQEAVPPPKGFAIQCRVTSEDPEQNFQVRAARCVGASGRRARGACARRTPRARGACARRTPRARAVVAACTARTHTHIHTHCADTQPSHTSLPHTTPPPHTPPPRGRHGHQPDSGRLEAYRPPGGPGIRLDSAVTAGNVVSRFYDSLLSKVIASAPTFDKAVQRMARALQEFQVCARTRARTRVCVCVCVCVCVRARASGACCRVLRGTWSCWYPWLRAAPCAHQLPCPPPASHPHPCLAPDPWHKDQHPVHGERAAPPRVPQRARDNGLH
jgi:hypothetical protein